MMRSAVYKDGCDVYVCEQDASHLHRVPVDAPRETWPPLAPVAADANT